MFQALTLSMSTRTAQTHTPPSGLGWTGGGSRHKCSSPVGATPPPSASAEVSKSLLNAGPSSLIMSVVVVARPCFWKAWRAHCLVSAQAPKAATRSGLDLRGSGVSGASWPPKALPVPPVVARGPTLASSV